MIAYVTLGFTTKERLTNGQLDDINQEFGGYSRRENSTGITYEAFGYIEGDNLADAITNAGALLRSLIDRSESDISTVQASRVNPGGF